MHLIQPMPGIEAILALIRQTARRFTSVPGEPLRAEDDAAIEQVGIDALHHTRALSDEQRQNRPQGSHRPGGKVGRCQLCRKHWRIPWSTLGALQAHERLGQGIDPRAVGIRTMPAVASHVGFNDDGD